MKDNEPRMEKLEEDNKTWMQKLLDQEKKVKTMVSYKDKQFTKISDHEALHERATTLD